MNRNFKTVVSRMLAGTMLLTSAFGNVVTINAADDAGSFVNDVVTSGAAVSLANNVELAEVVYANYDFESKTENDVIPAENTYAYYMNGAVVGDAGVGDGGTITGSTKAESTPAPTGNLHAYYSKGVGTYTAKSGTSVRIFDNDTTTSPELTFKAGAATGTEVEYSIDFMAEAIGSSMSPINLYTADGTVVAGVGTGNGTAIDLDGTTVPKVSSVFVKGSTTDGTTTTATWAPVTALASPATGTWYNFKFVVNTETKKMSVYVDNTLVRSDMDIASTEIDRISVKGSGGTNRMLWCDNVKVPTDATVGAEPNVGGGSTVETTTETTTEAATETTTEAATETTTEAGTETTTEAGGSSEKSDGSVSYSIAEEGDIVESATPVKGVIYTGDAEDAAGGIGKVAGVYTSNGLTISGAGKARADFGGKFSSGTITFTTEITPDATSVAGNPMYFEFWGDTTGTPSNGNMLCVRMDSGNFTLHNKLGGERLATTTAVKADVAQKVAISVDLDNNVAKLYVDDVEIASTTASIDTIENLYAVAFFSKAETGAYSISSAKMDYTASSMEATTVMEETTESTTEANTEETTISADSKVVSADKAGVGTADVENLKVGDEVVVSYKLNNLTGINNFTFYVDFDPSLVQLEGPETFDVADAVTYDLSGNAVRLVTDALITKQMAVVPAVTDTDYATVSPDGTKTAAQLGRIKLAGVAGLNESSTAVTNTDGVLFKLKFKVLKAGTVNVGLTPVGGSTSGNDLFYQVPVSGSGAEAVGTDKVEDAEVVAPATTTAPEFTYDGNGVKVAIAADGTLKVTGTNVKSYNAETGVLTLKSDATVTAANLVAALTAATTATATVTANGNKVTVADATDATKAVTIEVVSATGEVPPVTDDVTVTIGDTTMTVAVNGTGLTVTPNKGTAKTTATGAMVSIIGKDLGTITTSDVTAVGATVVYDAATYTATLTIDGKDYKLELFKFGDVDGDGAVTANDATIMISIYNNMTTATDIQTIAGDTDKDNAVTANDATLAIARYNDPNAEMPAEK